MNICHRSKPRAAILVLAVFAVGIGLFSLSVFSPQPGVTLAASTTVTFTSTQDTFVSDTSPGANHGQKAAIQVDGSPKERGLVRFAVTGLPTGASVDSAVLRLRVSNYSKEAGSVHAVSGAWSESSTTWANAPGLGAKLVDLPDPAAIGTWREVNLTAAVRGNGPVNVYVVSLKGDGTHYFSREAASGKPELVVRWSQTVTATPTATSTPSPTPTATPGAKPMFAYYYLWWSNRHWHDKLGAAYPYDRNPLPLPATLDANGCGAVSLYTGNQLADVPAALLDQDAPGVLEQDVRNAAQYLSGFIVDWIGTGDAAQTTTSISYSRRLESLVGVVHKLNAEGIAFKLWISYRSSSQGLTPEFINGDLTYLARQYGSDSAFDRRSGRPVLIWTGSRQYSLTTIRSVSEAQRGAFFLVGDENWKTWGDGRAAYLDGDTFYWSSQDPYGNPHSFGQLQDLAQMVRSSVANPDGSQKLWFSPLAPGYNSKLLNGGACIPRNEGETLRLLFEGNAKTDPDGWVLISWNEVAEGTYVEPLQRWGFEYLEV